MDKRCAKQMLTMWCLLQMNFSMMVDKIIYFMDLSHPLFPAPQVQTLSSRSKVAIVA